MNDLPRFYVTLAPKRHERPPLSAPDLRSALALARARLGSGVARLAVWMEAPAPDEASEAIVCVPVALFESRRAQAEEVVARWDAGWLLIDSVARRHREAARQHLVDEISMALLAAAIEGVGEPSAGEDDDPF